MFYFYFYFVFIYFIYSTGLVLFWSILMESSGKYYDLM